MSTVTILSTAPPTSTMVDIPANATSQASPPIVYFFRLVLSFASAAYSALLLSFSSAWSLFKTILLPVRSLLTTFSSPLLYILAPVIVLGRILLEVLIFAPYSLMTGAAREVYPIYVFIGATCIWAAFVGLCARGVTHYMRLLMFGPEDTTPTHERESAKIAEVPRAKGAKKVSIKEETDVKTILR
ncbi:uncharacterized protein PHACADRAFT_252826 [Phanerochaete carnosa HHB-10118-sp]|uniref:Uncharacterized protein n=1 Tax=Phanerochaete carnosa (strain HHB-10118-sp) TaxID=650164 RepID=K5X6I6_PHACS|nr:uncharacterized protein PHACADRAFT_252826 [Phanerochaete carnosa HHB-10118-sp]EKM58477.1 hypothetical protein PHACADRAFT_252826 [Phanerochaete carnosa HHB-10118-sp]